MEGLTMMTNWFMRNIAGSMFILLAASSVYADESRIPVYAPATTSTTIVINSPGSYFLTQNFSSSASPAISIQANNVFLDLNGRTVTKTGTGANIIADGYTNITIKNGVLAGGNNGVSLSVASPDYSHLTLSHLTIQDTTAYALYLQSVYADILSCRFSNTNTGGGALGAVLLQGSGRIIGNIITATFTNGFYLSSSIGLEFKDNVINDFNKSNSTSAGVYLFASNTKGANIVKDNTIVVGNSGSSGIRINDGSMNNIITGNTVRSCTHGIYVESNGNLISHNNLATGVYGLYLTATADRNLLDNNVIGGFSFGISFISGSTENAYRNNMLRGNVGGGVSDPGAANTDAGGNIL
jgi:parallel beta-helix repeat protein